MEKISTGDKVDGIEELNKKNEGRELDDIDLEKFDRELGRLEFETFVTLGSPTWVG